MVIDALAARYGGAAKAAAHLAVLLAENPAADGVVLLARDGSRISQELRPSAKLRLLTLPPARRLELAHRLLWEAFGLPRLIRRSRASRVMTCSGMLPRGVGVPVICYLANPVMFEQSGFGNVVRRWAVRRTAQRASHVLVPSEAMATLVANTLGRRPEVVPLGVDHARFTPAAQPGKDLLCVADFYAHKRHDVLLDAWAALPAPRPRLRLIGDPRVPRSWHRRVAAQAAGYRDLGSIVFDGGLSLDRLIDAYRRARVFALASEQESFCLTLLEAHACGVPAVVRDLPSLRETGGTAATYVAGDNPLDWASALGRLLSEDSAHTAARTASVDNARRFSWERTGQALRSLLLPPERTAV
jgi:glycosyltransferase involved in cell wall biosynthesis